ncbi:MAG TPA: hypothetical protein VGV60_01965 [Candidatus Polarisedimenticolia bacterium]|jgi:hypothetical protein|nr:hypothetical protein [Candidatus Polarisedimenticolia bacterium]
MARYVAIPTSTRQEHQVLLALRRLQRRTPLPDGTAAMRDELARFAELADEQRVRHLLDWFEGGQGRFGRLGGASRRRRDRFVLLFVLLAKTINLDDNLGLLRELNRLGEWGNHERLVRRLASLRGRQAGTGATLLAIDYLETAGEILFQDGGLIRDQAVTSVEEFSIWPWPLQVLHLLAWRARDAASQAQDAVSPACRASRLEFQLAREGLLGRVGARGGRLARLILKRLGYSNYVPGVRRGVMLRYGVAMFLLLASAVLVWQARRQIAAWNVSNRLLATTVIEQAEGRAGSRAVTAVRGVADSSQGAPRMSATDPSGSEEN